MSVVGCTAHEALIATGMAEPATHLEVHLQWFAQLIQRCMQYAHMQALYTFTKLNSSPLGMTVQRKGRWPDTDH